MSAPGLYMPLTLVAAKTFPLEQTYNGAFGAGALFFGPTAAHAAGLCCAWTRSAVGGRGLFN